MKINHQKVVARDRLPPLLAAHRRAGRTIVFTNGCFDVLHVGHVHLLQQAKKLGDVLVVAINSDASVRNLDKGSDRPIHPEGERAELIAAFTAVDYVTVFDESTPKEIIEGIQPDVLAKGTDWGENAVVGRKTVEAAGGKVVRIALVEGKSTTKMIGKIRQEKN